MELQEILRAGSAIAFAALVAAFGYWFTRKRKP